MTRKRIPCTLSSRVIGPSSHSGSLGRVRTLGKIRPMAFFFVHGKCQHYYESGHPRQSPGLGYKRVVSCKDSFHGTDVLAVSEHGAPGRRPNIHAHFVGRQREDGLDTLPATSPRRRSPRRRCPSPAWAALERRPPLEAFLGIRASRRRLLSQP